MNEGAASSIFESQWQLALDIATGIGADPNLFLHEVLIRNAGVPRTIRVHLLETGASRVYDTGSNRWVELFEWDVQSGAFAQPSPHA